MDLVGRRKHSDVVRWNIWPTTAKNGVLWFLWWCIGGLTSCAIAILPWCNDWWFLHFLTVVCLLVTSALLRSRSTIQSCTANIWSFGQCEKIRTGLENFCEMHRQWYHLKIARTPQSRPHWYRHHAQPALVCSVNVHLYCSVSAPSWLTSWRVDHVHFNHAHYHRPATITGQSLSIPGQPATPTTNNLASPTFVVLIIV